MQHPAAQPTPPPPISSDAGPTADESLTASLLSDADVAALTPLERRDLISRLQRDVQLELPHSMGLRQFRRLRLSVMIASAAILVPWIVYLALSLPTTYEAHNWPATWVGFDIGLVVIMCATVVLGLRRSQLVMLTAFATGVLLVCDAWFDIMTASAHDRWQSILSALFAELPIATILIYGALRMLHLAATRMWMLEPGQRLWTLQMPDEFLPGDLS